MRRIAFVLVVVGLALGAVGCPEKGPAQKAGEAVDEAVDKLTHPNEGPLERAGRKMDEAVEHTKHAVKGD